MKFEPMVYDAPADAPAFIECVEGSPYSAIRVCWAYCFECRAAARLAAIAAGVELGDEAGRYPMHVLVGRN